MTSVPGVVQARVFDDIDNSAGDRYRCYGRAWAMERQRGLYKLWHYGTLVCVADESDVRYVYHSCSASDRDGINGLLSLLGRSERVSIAGGTHVRTSEGAYRPAERFGREYRPVQYQL